MTKSDTDQNSLVEIEQENLVLSAPDVVKRGLDLASIAVDRFVPRWKLIFSDPSGQKHKLFEQGLHLPAKHTINSALLVQSSDEWIWISCDHYPQKFWMLKPRETFGKQPVTINIRFEVGLDGILKLDAEAASPEIKYDVLKLTGDNLDLNELYDEYLVAREVSEKESKEEFESLEIQFISEVSTPLRILPEQVSIGESMVEMGPGVWDPVTVFPAETMLPAKNTVLLPIHFPLLILLDTFVGWNPFDEDAILNSWRVEGVESSDSNPIILKISLEIDEFGLMRLDVRDQKTEKALYVSSWNPLEVLNAHRMHLISLKINESQRDQRFMKE